MNSNVWISSFYWLFIFGSCLSSALDGDSYSDTARDSNDLVLSDTHLATPGGEPYINNSESIKNGVVDRAISKDGPHTHSADGDKALQIEQQDGTEEIARAQSMDGMAEVPVVIYKDSLDNSDDPSQPMTDIAPMIAPSDSPVVHRYPIPQIRRKSPPPQSNDSPKDNTAQTSTIGEEPKDLMDATITSKPETETFIPASNASKQAKRMPPVSTSYHIPNTLSNQVRRGSAPGKQSQSKQIDSAGEDDNNQAFNPEILASELKNIFNTTINEFKGTVIKNLKDLDGKIHSDAQNTGSKTILESLASTLGDELAASDDEDSNEETENVDSGKAPANTFPQKLQRLAVKKIHSIIPGSVFNSMKIFPERMRPITQFLPSDEDQESAGPEENWILGGYKWFTNYIKRNKKKDKSLVCKAKKEKGKTPSASEGDSPLETFGYAHFDEKSGMTILRAGVPLSVIAGFPQNIKIGSRDYYIQGKLSEIKQFLDCFGSYSVIASHLVESPGRLGYDEARWIESPDHHLYLQMQNTMMKDASVQSPIGNPVEIAFAEALRRIVNYITSGRIFKSGALAGPSSMLVGPAKILSGSGFDALMPMIWEALKFIPKETVTKIGALWMNSSSKSGSYIDRALEVVNKLDEEYEEVKTVSHWKNSLALDSKSTIILSFTSYPRPSTAVTTLEMPGNRATLEEIKDRISLINVRQLHSSTAIKAYKKFVRRMHQSVWLRKVFNEVVEFILSKDAPES